MEVADLHVHGIEGLDTGTADAATMLGIATLQGEAGVAKLLLSLYPGPIDVMRSGMAAVQEAMERQAAGRPPGGTQTPEPAAACILGLHLEGPFLNPAWCGALDPAALLQPDPALLERLLDGFEDVVRTMTVAPELPGAPALIRHAADKGIIVNLGHSGATYGEAEAGFRAGARGITHLFNAMRPFHHREPGIAGFGLLHRGVYIEVIGDRRHLSPEVLDLVFRVKDPSRILLVSDSVAGTKRVALPGAEEETGKLLGGALTLPAAARGLAAMGFREEAVSRAVSANPREYLRLGHGHD